MWQFTFDENSHGIDTDSTTLKLKRSSFALKTTKSINVDVELYSILLGHEEAIYGLCWFPRRGKATPHVESTKLEKPATTILSASMDKSMVLWTFDEHQKMFIDRVNRRRSNSIQWTFLFSLQGRVGEIGGNTLGFYGCTFSPCGSFILGHGYEGALHLWKIEEVRLEPLA